MSEMSEIYLKRIAEDIETIKKAILLKNQLAQITQPERGPLIKQLLELK